MVADLIAFGELNREIIRLLVRDIEPKTDLSAVLTLIEEAAGVHTAEVGPIPPHDPVVTAPSALPAPTVLSIASDERVMLVTPSRTLIERVIFTLAPITIDGAQLIIFYRLQGTDANWQQATVKQETATTVIVTGLQSGETYDFRLLYRQSSYLSSPATTVNAYYVIGRTNPPADLQNLTIAVVGGQALLRWDLPTDLDVQIGGYIMFRHSPDMNATLWPNSTSIAQAVTGDQTHVYAPLKPGTYFARVYDADGRPSSGFSYVSTKQASVLAFASVDDLQEDPTFSGTKTNCEVVDDGLMLSGSDWDSVPDVDALPEWDIAGGNGSPGSADWIGRARRRRRGHPAGALSGGRPERFRQRVSASGGSGLPPAATNRQQRRAAAPPIPPVRRARIPVAHCRRRRSPPAVPSTRSPS